MTYRPILSPRKNQPSFQKQGIGNNFKVSPSGRSQRETPFKKNNPTQSEMFSQKKFVADSNRNNKILTWLSKIYPPLFQVENPKPLKVDIHRDLREALNSLHTLPFSKLSIRKAVSFHVRGKKYQKSIVTGKVRYNLEGKPVELITRDQKTYAQESLNQHRNRGVTKKSFQKSPGNKLPHTRNDKPKSLDLSQRKFQQFSKNAQK